MNVTSPKYAGVAWYYNFCRGKMPRLKDVPGDWQDIVVILNANRKSVDVAVPGGNYTVVGQEGRISEEGLGTVSGPTVSVAPQSALIIHN
jgi:pullulanase